MNKSNCVISLFFITTPPLAAVRKITGIWREVYRIDTKKMVLLHFLDDVLLVKATHVRPMVPEHERMKIHEDIETFFFRFYSRMHECSTTPLMHECMNAWLRDKHMNARL